MPKRKIDPTTGERVLAAREQKFVNEYINNGGNGSKAAAAAGYGGARPDQSAYQVLHRPEVQQRIRQRIAESRVSADEIIGTLASHMRGTPADFLDESGEFSIEIAKQRGVDHLLKSITVTTREIKATKNRPAQTVRTCRGTLHSPIQAAAVLARIQGINPKSLSAKARNRFSRPASDPETLNRDNIQRDFDPLVWLDDLINHQMRQTGMSRSAVVDILIQIRPEIAKYVADLEQAQTPGPFDDLSFKDIGKKLNVVLDSIIALRQDPPADPDPNSPDQARGSTGRHPDSKHKQRSKQSQSAQPHSAQPRSAQREAAQPEPAQPQSSPSEPAQRQPAQPQPAHQRQEARLDNTADRYPDHPTAPATQPSRASSPAPQSERPSTQPVPSPNLQPATCNLQPPANLQRESSNCDLRYWTIFGALSESEDKPRDQLRFRDVIQEWMDRFELTEAAAIDAIRQRAGLEPWLFGYIIGECIKEYVDMRSASLIPEPVLTKQPPALQPFEAIPTPDSRLPTPDSEPLGPHASLRAPVDSSADDNQESQSLSMFSRTHASLRAPADSTVDDNQESQSLSMFSGTHASPHAAAIDPSPESQGSSEPAPPRRRRFSRIARRKQGSRNLNPSQCLDP